MLDLIKNEIMAEGAGKLHLWKSTRQAAMSWVLDGARQKP